MTSSDFLSNLVITRVYSASTMVNPESTRVKRNDRPNSAVVIKYEGETVYFSNGKRFLSDSNHLVILPKGCSYEWLCVKSGRFAIVEFESEAVGDEPIIFPVKSCEKFLKIILDLEHKRNLRSHLFELESIRDVYSLILSLSQAANEKYLPSEKQNRIAPAIEYISHNYNKGIKNDELASLTGISTVYFRKLFTITVGVSPITYAHRIRIEKAKEMLKSDYETIEQVALSVGYNSLYHFSKMFKKYAGTSPGAYAKASQK